MRVCLLSKMFPPVKGGSARYAYEIANGLGARGHDVDVFTQAVAGESMELPLEDTVQVHRICRARRKLVTFETLYYSLLATREVDFSKYDVIHGTMMPASTICLRKSPDPPVVLTSHSFAPSEVRSHSAERLPDYLLKYVFHPTNALFDFVAGQRADHVISISSGMADQLKEKYRLNQSKLSMISHGVDSRRFTPGAGSHPAVSTDKTTALFVGRLVTRKGADRAIESIARTERDDIELLVAGTGRDEPRLRDLAANLGVADRVEFLGYVPDEQLPELYAGVDVLLFASEYEGFGLVILEAMACGTPVIGTPVGGVPDVVNDGENGFIASHDPKSFAEDIDRIHDSPELLDRLSQNARNTAEELTWDHVAAQVETVYNSVL